MKIVHISTANTGGGGIAAYRLHLALRQHVGIESAFVQQHNYNKSTKGINLHTVEPKRDVIYSIKRKLGLIPETRNWKKVTHVPINYEIVTFPNTSYRVEDMEIVKQADIIHLHWVAGFINYPTFFKKIKQPIVWTLHDLNPFQGIFHYEDDQYRNKNSFGSLDNKIYQQKIKYIHQHKNISVVSPSQWIDKKAKVSETFKQYAHYVIPHGLDLSDYPIIDKEIAKNKLGINDNLKTILFVSHGTNIRRKGFDLLFDAIKQINRNDFNLISVGGNKIAINEYINHIHFERIADFNLLNTIYSASDITVIPSREDVFNLVMQESIANGTPVISFNNGGMAEHIQTGINGILLPKINSKLLATELSSFIDGIYDFNKDVIRQYAKNTFSDTLQTERYIELYKQILIK